MDAQSLAAYEARAAQAEQRLAVLESKLAAGQVHHRNDMQRRPACLAAAAAAIALQLNVATLLATAPAGGNSSSGGGSVDVSRYVAELQSLKNVLLTAKTEQDALEKCCSEVGGPGCCPFNRDEAFGGGTLRIVADGIAARDCWPAL
jgi:hypothetical protein